MARWPQQSGWACSFGCPASHSGSSGTRSPSGAPAWTRSSCRSSRGTSSTGNCWTCEDITMMNLTEYRKRPALLADWLPWSGLVAKGVVLNKDGSFQRTARFRGPDLDSATASELVAITSRLNNALRRLGSGWAIFVEAQREPANRYPDSTFPDRASGLVDAERRAQFEEEGAHFESRYFLTLVWLPPADDAARAEAWLYEGRSRSDGDWRNT